MIYILLECFNGIFLLENRVIGSYLRNVCWKYIQISRMINKVVVLDANYSGLEKIYPKGTELRTDSDFLLLVGPNWSGKTAFLRMLGTSLRNERFFQDARLSRKIGSYVNYPEVRAVSRDGLMGALELGASFEIQPNRYACRVAYEIIDNLLGKDSNQVERKRLGVVKEDIQVVEMDKKIEAKIAEIESKLGIKVDSNSIDQTIDSQNVKLVKKAYCVTNEGMKKVRRLIGKLSRRTDRNVWGYLKVVISGGPLYFQEFYSALAVPLDYGTKTGNKQHTHFDPNCSREDKSPGAHSMETIKLFLAQVDAFFEQGVNPIFYQDLPSFQSEPMDVLDMDRTMEKISMGYKKGQEQVPSNAQLVAFLDEPSPFLDYRNKYRFRDALCERIQRYQGRLQVFMATNDAVMIEHLPNCRYINLYEQPAKCTKNPPIVNG